MSILKSITSTITTGIKNFLTKPFKPKKGEKYPSPSGRNPLAFTMKEAIVTGIIYNSAGIFIQWYFSDAERAEAAYQKLKSIWPGARREHMSAILNGGLFGFLILLRILAEANRRR